ncbi:Xylanase inhibitor, N-terminal [Dillenia turbinata]|uniref:Xylanase inhibitor, N-terminal n=1 Tax=Dillenia turbinata TaxID=194707 RepID=A0AAN8UXW6_9MAGN
MEGRLIQFTIVVLFLLFAVVSSFSDHNGSLLMILPLFLSPPHSSRLSSTDYFRRRLHKSNPQSSVAEMRLFDDLLISGYYTTRVWIGTPPQEFALIVDTGSTITYVPCSTCSHCGRHQDPNFLPELSSTYHPVKCNAGCICDNKRAQCLYKRQYAEMSSSSGVLAEDIISFGNESKLSSQRAIFGCENVETGDIYSQQADGIMGLGRGDFSIVDQLVAKGVIGNSFSLCYGGMDVGGGAMVLGQFSSPSDMVFSHSDPLRSPYYNIELKEILVAGKPLPLNPVIFNGKHGTVLDSGTTYAYLPEAAFLAFKDAGTKLQIIQELHSLKQVRGPDPSYNDICFAGAGSDVLQLSKFFPAVEMVFDSAQKLTLSPENYLFRHTKVSGAYCLGIFSNGKDPTTLLGGIIVRNILVSYDREHKKIGFLKTNCSELLKGLGAPPSVSSSGQSPDSIPEKELRIGRITFDMFLNMSYADLKPRINELRELIANEFHVNNSQIHLISSNREGNGSFIRWAINPSESSEFISNATATSIVSILSEHGIQLTDNFGNYELVDYKIESLATRYDITHFCSRPSPLRGTWWQQHQSAVIVAVIIMLLLGLSACQLWLIWRNRRGILDRYKPIDTATLEPELQLQPQQPNHNSLLDVSQASLP